MSDVNLLKTNNARNPFKIQNLRHRANQAKDPRVMLSEKITSDKITPRVLQCKNCSRLSEPMKLSMMADMIRKRELFCKACGCHEFKFFRNYLGMVKQEGKYDYVLKEKNIIKKLPLPDGGI